MSITDSEIYNNSYGFLVGSIVNLLIARSHFHLHHYGTISLYVSNSFIIDTCNFDDN